MTHASRSIADYDEIYEPIRGARVRADGRQPGDPDKAAAVVLRVIEDRHPPRHLVLGSAALDALAAAREASEEDVRQWEARSRSTDFTETGQRGAQDSAPAGH